MDDFQARVAHAAVDHHFKQQKAAQAPPPAADVTAGGDEYGKTAHGAKEGPRGPGCCATFEQTRKLFRWGAMMSSGCLVVFGLWGTGTTGGNTSCPGATGTLVNFWLVLFGALLFAAEMHQRHGEEARAAQRPASRPDRWRDCSRRTRALLCGSRP
jgi:hypothetical protein